MWSLFNEPFDRVLAETLGAKSTSETRRDTEEVAAYTIDADRHERTARITLERDDRLRTSRTATQPACVQ